MSIIFFQIIFFLLLNNTIQLTDASNSPIIYSDGQEQNPTEEEEKTSLDNCLNSEFSPMFICILNQTKLKTDLMESIFFKDGIKLISCFESFFEEEVWEKLAPFLNYFFNPTKPSFNITFKLIRKVDENNKNILDYVINIVNFLNEYENDKSYKMSFLLENIYMIFKFPGFDELFIYIDTSELQELSY